MEVRRLLLALAALLAASPALAQFSGQLPPGSVLGNASTSTSQPSRPVGAGDTGVLLAGGACAGGGFLCGGASPLTLGIGTRNTYLNIDGGVIGSGTDASVVFRKGGLPIAEAGVGFNDIDTDWHTKTVKAAKFTASQSGTTLTVTAVTAGTLFPGALVTDNNPPFIVQASPAVVANSTIVSQLTGTTGGVGTYELSQSATVASRTMLSELFEDRLLHNNWLSARAGWTDLFNDTGVSVYYQSGIRYLAFGSLVPNFTTGTGSGEGLALAYDLGSSNAFLTSVAYGVNYQPLIAQSSNFRISTAFTDSLDNAVVTVEPDGALTAAHPTRYATAATTFNTGAASIATMNGYVAGSSIVTACTTASKFCVQVGTPPAFNVATTQVASAAKNAGGSGGTNSVATTTTAVSAVNATTLIVNSIIGIANADNVFVTCGGGTANEPPYYTGTVNGAPSGSTVTVTPALTCNVNSGLAVVAKYATLTGTTGTGTRYTAAGKVVGGALDSVLAILTHGSYTVNPTACAASVASCSEPVTATGGLTAATTTIAMGALTFTLNNAGAIGADATRTYPQTPVQTTSSDNGVGAKLAIAYNDADAINVGAKGLYIDGVAPTGTGASVRAIAPTLTTLNIDNGAAAAALISFKDNTTTKFTAGKNAGNDWSLFDSVRAVNALFVNGSTGGVTIGETTIAGVAIGNPTGGILGTGTLNVDAGYYVDGVLVTGCAAGAATGVLFSDGAACTSDVANFFYNSTEGQLSVKSKNTFSIPWGLTVLGGDGGNGGSARFGSNYTGAATGYISVGWNLANSYSFVRSTNSAGTLTHLALNQDGVSVSAGTVLASFVGQPAENAVLLSDPSGASRWAHAIGLSGAFKGGLYFDSGSNAALRLWNTSNVETARISSSASDTSVVPNRFTAAGLRDNTVLTCALLTTDGDGDLTCGSFTGLTLTTTTLSGTTTLPDSGEINSTGDLGIGAAPTARLHVAGTYTSANARFAQILGTLASSATGSQSGLAVNTTFTPTGATLTSLTVVSVAPTLGASTPASTVVRGVQFAPTISAAFAGTVTTLEGFSAAAVTNNTSIPITSFIQFHGGAITNGDGLTSGTVTNRQFNGAGITAGAAGGTVNNRVVTVTVPAGGASSGTANNRGLYITGNGGTAAGGTVNNHAIYNESTAPNYLVGKLLAGGTAPALSSCGTTPAIVGDDKAGEVTMGTGTPTGCVITFNVAYVSAPYCTVTWQATPLASQSYTVSSTAITLTQTATSSNKVNYVCWGRSGG